MEVSPMLQRLGDNDPIQVSGQINFDSVLRYRRLGEEFIKSNNEVELKFDLSKAEISGSIGVSLLLCWVRAANNAGKKLAFQQIPVTLCEMIRVSGVEQILAVD